jgi:molybdate transport system substrate-binding protein
MPVPRAQFLLALVLAVLLPLAGPAQAQVSVFAAASLKTALDAGAEAYTQISGEPVTLTYAGSSALARQIEYGAPADLFLSANEGWMDLLETRGLIQPGSRADLLTNQLVLIAAPGVTVQIDLTSRATAVAALAEGRLAMALIDAVPAGIYGRAALETLGLWDSLRDQVVQTDNVRAALKLVSMAETPFGIVYATDAAAEPTVRVVDVFPADSHPPIRYPVALIGRSGRGTALLEFLTGSQAAAIFLANGFALAARS